MAFGSADDYYSDMFDYYDDPARAGTIIFRTFEIFNCSYLHTYIILFSMDFKLSPQVAMMHYPENFQLKTVVRN